MSMTRIKRTEGKTLAHVVGLLLLIGTATVTATVTATYTNDWEDGSIPTFSFAELQGLSESEHRAEDFRQALSTNGLLAIQLEEQEDFLGYPNDRRIALDGLCSCVDHPEFLKLDQTHELTLMDSSTARTSVATATVGLDHPLPLPKGMEDTCGETVLDAMEGLRDVVASVSREFVLALDASLGNTNAGNIPPATLLRDEFGRSYKSVSDIVKSANHLEHFHVYTNNEEQNPLTETISETTATAWDWHTDAGLFLVFVPAWDCNGGDESSNIDESFYYRDTDGKTVRAKFDGGRTAIVMLGQGAQDWLDLPEKSTNHKRKSPMLKATTHSVRWSSEQEKQEQPMRDNLPKQRRAWYGMMNLVPEASLIYGGKTLRDVKQSLSLYHQHKTDYQPSSELASTAGVPLGCGSVPAPPFTEQSEGIDFELEEVGATSRRRRHLKMQDASICNNVTNFFCWMTCMDIPEPDQAPLYLEAGYSLYCVDEPILRETGKLNDAADACIDIHNMGCKGIWQRTDDDVTPVEINATAIQSVDPEDLEYPFCYSGTTMYMEGFQWVQSSTCVILLFPSWVLNTSGKFVLAVIGTIFLAIGLEKFIQQRRKAMACMEHGTKRLVTSAIFYGVQLIIGYVLMLIIMVYSVVLFLSVILGLVIGHVLFNARDAIWPIHEPQLMKDKEIDIRNGEAKNDANLSVGLPGNSSSKRSMYNQPDPAEERALREGSTHCQELEDDDAQEYYGSMENGNTQKVDAAGNPIRKKAPRRRTIDQEVAEGSTPCCQHSEA